jgi:peptidoglycan/LPS O-acetylase OafA/YrhL
VSFFFILSGFVLTWSARSEDTPGRFLRRRFTKIFPNHIVTWAATLLIFAWVGQQIAGAPTVLNLLLVHTWVPKLEYFGSVNPVSWSLACEVLFYLSFPVLLRLVKKIRPERLWLTAVLVVATIFVVPLFAKVMSDQPIMPGTTTPVQEFWFVYGLPPVRGLEFLLGMVMARLLTTGRRMPLSLGPALLLVVVGYFVAQNVSLLYSLVAAAGPGDPGGGLRGPARASLLPAPAADGVAGRDLLRLLPRPLSGHPRRPSLVRPGQDDGHAGPDAPVHHGEGDRVDPRPLRGEPAGLLAAVQRRGASDHAALEPAAYATARRP